ncbi:MAG: TIGR04190 family B12-binding domain/radical SAM domain protein [Actinobacteria bacterium]|nr:TIGR04190 family B12-binding domain/radical SAM domain protein [Actinomycetota bacterium]
MVFAQPDLVLLHPPSVYDFRTITTVPSPLSDLSPSTTAFENYPIGFAFLGEYLERNGINTRIVNLAQRMLEDDGFDVPRFLSRLRPRAFGVDFHWLTHAQGVIEVSRLLKEAHPDIPVILGGYTASFYHHELMQYPQVDFVIRGDSAEEPLRRLMESLMHGGSLDDIPNLTYRDSRGEVVENPLTYVPANLEYLGDGYRYMIRSALKYRDRKSLGFFWNWWRYPMTMVLTCRGCSYDCVFCGGSESAHARLCGRGQVAFRPPEKVASDVGFICKFTTAPIFLVGDLLQGGREYAMETIELLSQLNPRNQLVFELFAPAPREYFDRVASSFDNFNFQISPATHDETLREAIGKPYGNEELERNIAWVIESGCGKCDLFFMIGLPGQSRDSVMETVEYCAYLLRQFGPRLNPSIGPVAPFIDPGCTLHREAQRYGLRIIHRSIDDYARASLSPHWRDMLGYETDLLSRQDIVDVTYEALIALNAIKGKNGIISAQRASLNDRRLRDTVSLLKLVDDILALPDPMLQLGELAKVREEALKLQRQLYMPKEELTWPLMGSRFKRLNLLRIMAGWI